MGWWAVKAAAVVGASVAISRFVGNRTPPWVANTLRDNPVVRTQMATKMGEAVGLNEEQQFVEHHYSLLSDVEWAISAIKASERVEGSRASDSEDSELDSQAVVSHEAWPKVTIIKQDSAVETEAKSTGSANAAGGG